MNHLPIRVNTLRGDYPVDFDTFLQINGAMILYVRRGDIFDTVRLDRLRAKRVKQMYILIEDQPLYLQYVENNIRTAYDMQSPHSMDERAQVIVAEQKDNAELTFEDPSNEQTYLQTKQAMLRFVDLLMNHDRALKAILRIPNIEKSLSHHGVMVAAMSISLAKRLGFEAKRIQTMALGALLHDIGLRDARYAGRSVSTLTPAEKADYDQHSQHGVNLTRDKKHFDQAVLNIIDQHEACIDGSGIPALQEHEMDPLTVVVATANAMDRMMAFDGVPVYEIQKKMMVQRIGKHPLTHIQHLSELLRETFGF